MKEIAKTGDNRMTLKEVAEATGAAYSTVAAYAQKAGWTENGRQTLLDERQVTLIIEAMKTEASSGHKSNLLIELEGVETGQSRVLRLQILQRQVQEIYEAEIAELRANAERDRSKVEFYDQVADSSDAISMREVAALLNVPGWGRNNIFVMLRERGILDGKNLPYREYQDRGYFRVIEQKWTDDDGETHLATKTLVHQKGVDFIRRLVPGNVA